MDYDKDQGGVMAYFWKRKDEEKRDHGGQVIRHCPWDHRGLSMDSPVDSSTSFCEGSFMDF